MKADKLLTVRIPGSRLRKVMRARGITQQSELIQRLLAEEEERLESLSILRKTADTVSRTDFDDRFL